MDLGPHAAFIWISYAAVTVVVAALIAWLVFVPGAWFTVRSFGGGEVGAVVDGRRGVHGSRLGVGGAPLQGSRAAHRREPCHEEAHEL